MNAWGGGIQLVVHELSSCLFVVECTSKLKRD